MDDLAAVEFSALRETIRTRGTARVAVLLAGFASWAVVVILVMVWLPVPMAAVVPLLVLVATFEVVRVLHLGVERVGRYIQVFYEDSAGQPLTTPAWERTAMAFGPTVPGAAGHPLFLPLFLMATVVNGLAVVLPGPILVEGVTLAVPHLAFVAWLAYCDRGMRRQRAADLARYRALKAAAASPPR
jgi:hypothetical protein